MDNADKLDVLRGRKRAPAPAPQQERTSEVAQLLRDAGELLRELTDDCDVLDLRDNDQVCVFCYNVITRRVRGQIVEYGHETECPVTRAREWLREAGMDGEQ